MKYQIRPMIILMRPKQWIKNCFVFAPLVFSSLFLNQKAVFEAIYATILFCVASSAVYIVNDLKDIEHDRQHHQKSKIRPLARGDVSILEAIFLLSFLYVILFFNLFIVPYVISIILIYILLNFGYTFFFKYQPVLDIFAISLGFVLRIYAGAVALHIPLSSWMLITTLSLSLYLTSIKRRQEITHNGTTSRKILKNYSVALIDRYAEMSATSAIIFYSMFVMSTKPALIITIPFVLFGLFRYWYVVETHENGESPTDTFFSDKQLLFTVIIWIGICMWRLWPTHTMVN